MGSLFDIVPLTLAPGLGPFPGGGGTSKGMAGILPTQGCQTHSMERTILHFELWVNRTKTIPPIHSKSHMQRLRIEHDLLITKP